MKNVRYNDTDKDTDMNVPILTPTEKCIYDFMLKHKGKEIPRKMFASIIGDRNMFGSNLLDVHVKNLRRKLPEGAIETIRGVGYKLV
jgi:DNA-binding response OmpR family regulator